jgi:DNA polymerase
MKIFIAIETRSGEKLIGGNLARYTNSPLFEIICLSFYDDKRKVIRTYTQKDSIPYFLKYLAKYYANESITLIAHNINFEYSIFRSAGFFDSLQKYNIKYDFECTMSYCLALSIPASLASACVLVGTNRLKDEGSLKFIAGFCNPDQETGHLKPLTPQAVQLFSVHCRIDVVAAVDLYNKLPKHRDSSGNLKNTLAMNFTGLPVDVGLAKKVVTAVEEVDEKEKETSKINVRSHQQMIGFCAAHGFTLADCKKSTIEIALRSDPPPKVAQVLHARLGVKSSLTRYKVIPTFHVGSRLKDLFFYYGAHTGRDTDRIFQPQSLPKGGEIESKLLTSIDDADFLHLMGYSVKDIAVGGLRSIIRKSPQKKGFSSFFCGDFASIELRVLLWLSGDFEKLDWIKSGKDLYKELSAKIFNKAVEDVTDDERHLGKEGFLGLGYGLGAETFANLLPDTIQNRADFAQKTVEIYRKEYQKTVALWSKMREAVENLSSFDALGISVQKLKKFNALAINLPSKRRLFYSFFESKMGKMSYFTTRPKSTVKKIREETGVVFKGQQFYRHNLYGGKIVHNLTQAIARDLLFDAHKRLAKKGYCVLARVHDEILAERVSCDQNLNEFISIMKATDEKVYKNLPLDVEGWEGDYYRK